MNYEEKYKEAMKRADSLTEKYGGREFAEYVFPELAESEDQRIRKHIIEILNSLPGCYWHGEKDKSDCVTYLEKQKERGPLTKEEEYTLHRIIEYLEDEICPSEWVNLLHDIYCLPYQKQKEPHYTKRNALFDKCVENCDPKVMKEVSDEIDEMLEKEQKPSHKFNVGDIIHCKYDDREFTIKSVDLANGVYKYTKEGCGNDIDYADENFELVEQKPAEWSDYKDKVNVPYCSSEPEWSEEKTKDLFHILKVLDDCYAYGKHDLSKTDHDNLTSMIKSLRPSWKPSEEQMEALEDAFRKNGSDEYRKTINSLYQDLKKL